MQEITRHPYQNTPRDAVVTTVDYADGTLFPLHDHQRGQFAYAASGVITVFTDDGNWVVPPQRGIWVPAQLPHSMQMRGPVTLHNTYIRKQAAQRLALPEQCQVLDVSPLLRQLLLKAIDVPARYASQGRDGHLMSLLLHEIAAMPALSLNAPLPAEPRLALVCRKFLSQPSLEVSIDDMAQRAGMSRRTFTRHFRLHTGISYIEWRQQACLLAAVVLLGKGQSVTEVAMTLGYSSSSAFATVFKQLLGEVPSRYLVEQLV
ncbi:MULTISPECIES: AraC family transcriptional regulator [unclassified Pseudomonas]|jgi:AraC-like DNA-binding protein|uniref:AraC family transcriptional regulator n=1 Tax=unclassified Pseudomonas TaxID=196821 RepID=UPI000C822E3B|nr:MULTISPECIES: helix-turn-helix transcriptional regulator [unclassified Pseudomonas]MDX9674202.1 helix-turn-helix transcriptional regulator [Pseudomonas sp. P8_250]PMQ09690.1 HTH-type transcriptional repressor of iron proteins A [Pseudomonas sp. AD21]WPN37279.1 helix-turn-helix transcriptional regulator [Pseudomonas sp. P8_139]WPN40919.1 helix-turn-helix transcriptional regulator [Pseudomonas sp. P8_229]